MGLDSFNQYDQEETTPKTPETKNPEESNNGIGEEEALLLVDKEFSKEKNEVISEAKTQEKLLKTEILVKNNPLANLYHKYLKQGRGEEVKPLITKLKEMGIEDRPHNVFTKIDEFKDMPQAMDLFTATLETKGMKVGIFAMNVYSRIKDKEYATQYLQTIAIHSPLTALDNVSNSLSSYDSEGNRSEYTMSNEEQNIIKNQALTKESISKDITQNPDAAVSYFKIYKDQPYAKDLLRLGLEKDNKKVFNALSNFQEDPETQRQYISMITDPSFNSVREKVSPGNVIKNIKVIDQTPELQGIKKQILSPEKINQDFSSTFFDNFNDWKEQSFAPDIIKKAGDMGSYVILQRMEDVEKIEGGHEAIKKTVQNQAEYIFDNNSQKSASTLKTGKKVININNYWKKYDTINPYIKEISKELHDNPPKTMDVNLELIATSPKIASLLQFVDTDAKPFLVKDKELPLDRRSVQFMSGLLKQANKTYPNQEDLGVEERNVIHKIYEDNLNAFLDKHEEKKQESDTVDVFFAYASTETPGEDHNGAFANGGKLKDQYQESYGANNMIDFSSNTENAQAPNSMMDKIRDQLVQKVIAGNAGLSLVDIGLHGSPDGSAAYGPRDKVVNEDGKSVWKPRNEGRDWKPEDFERLVNISKEVRETLEKESPDALKDFEEKFGSFDDRIQIHIDSCFSGSKLDDEENSVRNVALSSGKQEALNTATDWLLDAHKRDADGNLKGDFDGDGKVTFAESKLYQLANYSSSITKTTFGNDAGETIELANIDAQQNPEYDDRFSTTG